MWFISSWEENNYCQSWENLQNDNHFHSKWQLLTVLSKNNHHFVNLHSFDNIYFVLRMRLIAWFIRQQLKAWRNGVDQRQPKQFEGQTFNGPVGQISGRPGPGFEGQIFNGPVGNQRRPSTGQQLTGTRYVYRVQDFHKKFFLMLFMSTLRFLLQVLML